MEQFKAFLEQFHTSGVSDAYRFLGCHAQNRDGVDGFVFRTWAPQAQSVRVTGDFNFWNEEDLPMQPCRAQNPSGASRFLRQRQQQMLRSDVAVPQLARKTPRLHDQSPQSSG